MLMVLGLLFGLVVHEGVCEDLKPELNLGNGYFLHLDLGDDDKVLHITQASPLTSPQSHGESHFLLSGLHVIIYVGNHPDLNLNSDQAVKPIEEEVNHRGTRYRKSVGEKFNNYIYSENEIALHPETAQPVSGHYNYTIHIKNHGLTDELEDRLLAALNRKRAEKKVFMGTDTRWYITAQKGENERAYRIVSKGELTENQKAVNYLRRYLYGLDLSHELIAGHTFKVPHHMSDHGNEQQSRIAVTLQSQSPVQSIDREDKK